MDPGTQALIAAGISAAGSIGGSMLASNSKESKGQKQRRKLIDELIRSLTTGGAYSDLFAMDENVFQKSFVDPAKALYQNQIAPQIKQSYIAGGQQRGTGMEDTLTRAGVDLDQMLNEKYMEFYQQAQGRKMDALKMATGAADGVGPRYSTGEKAQAGAAGFLSSDAFKDMVQDVTQSYTKQPEKGEKGAETKEKREGFQE